MNDTERVAAFRQRVERAEARPGSGFLTVSLSDLRYLLDRVAALEWDARRYATLKRHYHAIDFAYGSQPSEERSVLVFTLPGGVAASGNLDATLDAYQEEPPRE